MRGINKEFLQRNVALRMRKELAPATSFAQVEQRIAREGPTL